MRRNLNAFKFPQDKALLLPVSVFYENGPRGQNNVVRKCVYVKGIGVTDRLRYTVYTGDKLPLKLRNIYRGSGA